MFFSFLDVNMVITLIFECLNSVFQQLIEETKSLHWIVSTRDNGLALVLIYLLRLSQKLNILIFVLLLFLIFKNCFLLLIESEKKTDLGQYKNKFFGELFAIHLIICIYCISILLTLCKSEIAMSIFC